MASIRKTKKLLKMRKQAVEISVKDWDIEDGNKALVTMDCSFEFTKFGITVICCDIPCEFIPYWQIGQVKTIKLWQEKKLLLRQLLISFRQK